MTIIKCKMCGGDMELSADLSCGKCEYCGSVMTLPKVDGEQTASAFNRGNDFRRIGEFDKALAVYERIVEEDDTNAEAHWCCALCRFGIEYVEDPETHEYIPTCHRASFDSILNDVDYLAALKHADAVAKEQYRRDGEKIAEVQKGVLAVSQKEEPFDVFLCYKESEEDGSRTKESVRAQELYYELTEQGRRVFFARVTLEDKGGTEYEPYIFAALHSAKVMIVIGSSAAHLNAVWVKNEWSRFLKLMKQDRKKLLIPCYLDMDPYDMPEQLSILQSYDMGKIGFMQDLTRGINKVLDDGKEKEAEPQKEPQGETGNFSALVQRGNIALEDGEWERADEFFEQALNLDADEPHAYIGKFLAQQREVTLERLVKKREAGLSPGSGRITDACPEDREAIEEAMAQYVIPQYFSREKVYGFFTFNRNYRVKAERWDAVYEQEAAFWEGNKLFQRALEFSRGGYREELQRAHDGPLDAIRRQQEEDRQADEAERAKVEKAYREHTEAAKEQVRKYYEDMAAAREKDYRDACEKQETAKTSDELEQALAIFQRLAAYQDSKARAEACEERLFALRQAAEELIRQERKKKRRKSLLIGGSATAALLAVLIFAFVTIEVIPASRYAAAETLANEEKYGEAIEAFTALGSYRDAPQRVEYLKTAQLNAETYTVGEALLRDGKYLGAISTFRALGDYKDAPERLKAAKRLLAEQQAELTEQYAQANSSTTSRFPTEEEKEAALALGSGEEYEEFKEEALKAWEKVAPRPVLAGGALHWLAVVEDGKVFPDSEFTGSEDTNNYGQCNVRSWTDIVAVAANEMYSVGLKSDGTVVGAGDFSDSLTYWTDIVAIAAGGDHTVGLKADGTVVAAGTDHYGVGATDISDWTDMVAVAAGFGHTVGLKADGTVTATGENKKGQCNVSDWTDIAAIAAGSRHTVGVKSDGTVVATGNNSRGQCDVSDWTDIVQVAAGWSFTIGLRDDGTVVMAGSLDSNSPCDAAKLNEEGPFENIGAGRYFALAEKDGVVTMQGYY